MEFRARRFNPTPIFTFLVSSLFLFMFLFLPSNSYTAADGSTRCVEVFQRGELFIHGNNHLLYPVHIYFFNEHILRPIGLVSRDGFEYFTNSTILNSLASAIALGLLFLLAFRLTSSYFFSINSTMVIGFSRSFLISATNPNEPMVGYLISIAAVCLSVIGLNNRSIIYCCLSGFLLAYSTASYQSMILVLPALLTLYACHAVNSKNSRARFFILTGGFLITLCLSFLLLYGVNYYVFHGIASVEAFASRFLQLDGADSKGLWGSFEWINVIAIWFGLVRALFEVPYQLREIYYGDLSNVENTILWWSAPIILVGAMAIVVCSAWWNLRKHDEGALLTSKAIFVFFVFTLLGPFYWIIGYSKLWLQPLAALSIWTVYVLSKYLSHISEGKAKRLCIFILAFQLTLVMWNFKKVLITNHAGDLDLVTAVKNVDDLIENDCLVFCTWDTPCVLLRDFLGRERQFVMVHGYAIRMDEPELISAIDTQIRAAKNEAREVYFFTVLDLTKEEWDIFLGRRGGIDYHSFEKYRQRAEIVERVNVGKAKLDIYQYRK